MVNHFVRLDFPGHLYIEVVDHAIFKGDSTRNHGKTYSRDEKSGHLRGTITTVTPIMKYFVVDFTLSYSGYFADIIVPR